LDFGGAADHGESLSRDASFQAHRDGIRIRVESALGSGIRLIFAAILGGQKLDGSQASE